MVGIKEAGRKGKGHFFQGRKRARGQLSLLLLGAVCCVRAQLVLMATADQAAACYCSTTVRPVALFPLHRGEEAPRGSEGGGNREAAAGLGKVQARAAGRGGPGRPHPETTCAGQEAGGRAHRRPPGAGPAPEPSPLRPHRPRLHGRTPRVSETPCPGGDGSQPPAGTTPLKPATGHRDHEEQSGSQGRRGLQGPRRGTQVQLAAGGGRGRGAAGWSGRPPADCSPTGRGRGARASRAPSGPGRPGVAGSWTSERAPRPPPRCALSWPRDRSTAP